MSSLSVITTNVCKSVPDGNGSRDILSNVSLNVRASSITALIGRSGAGKSTLLRCLNGLDTIDSGQILISAENGVIPQRQGIAMIFQAYTLLSRKTVLQNVCLPITLRGVTLTDMHMQKAIQLLGEVGLSDKMNSYPSYLSGGQRQRVAIARALMLDPGLLLCDELTSALDPKTTIEILALLKRVNKDHGVTIILVTHDMDVVKEVADTVCVMDDGRIVEQGSVIDVLIKPKHTITRQLIEATAGGALPPFISDRIQQTQIHANATHSDIVLKLIFTNESSTKPIIAAVATTFGVCFSIIAGSLDNLSDKQSNTMFGHLWVSCPTDGKLEDAIRYMTDHGVGVETLGFISWEQ
ncbi:MAG: methionine ABC transporter ATP-binding protein [Pseudomonadota bacterium]